MEMEKKKKNQTSILNFFTLYQGRKRCKRMREGRRCHSKWLKENRRIDLRVIKENLQWGNKMVKKIAETLETDLNSEVLSIGLKRHWENKAARSTPWHTRYEQVLLQDTMSGAGRVGRRRAERWRSVLTSLRDPMAKLYYAQSVQYFYPFPWTWFPKFPSLLSS